MLLISNRLASGWPPAADSSIKLLPSSSLPAASIMGLAGPDSKAIGRSSSLSMSSGDELGVWLAPRELICDRAAGGPAAGGSSSSVSWPADESAKPREL